MSEGEPTDPTAAEAAAEAYELAPCGLLSTAPDGRIVRANATIAEWTGHSVDELLDRRFQDLLTIGSKLFHQTHWLPLLQMQGSVAEVELELKHRDGRVVPVLVNARQRGPIAVASVKSQRPLEIALLVATDRRKYESELRLARRRAEELLASEREAQEARAAAEAALRRSEAEFRTLAENSPDVIVRLAPDKRCLYVSPAALRLTGRAAADYIGKRLDEIGLDDASGTVWADGVDAALVGESVTINYVAERESGARQMQAHLVPERNEQGQIISVLGIARDVTVLRQRELEAHERAIFAEQLIGIVSHDLRNPLNAIGLGAELLSTCDLGPEARTLARISSAARRANRLIGDLLDFTQARLGGGLRVSPREIDLHAVAGEVLEEIRLASPGRNIVHRRSGSGMGLAEPDRVAQILTNLVSNGLAYGAAEQALTVTTTSDRAGLKILVHNFGPPIPLELHERIFEPMRRGSTSMKPGARSVGLGLFIIRQIAVAHGGSVSVSSNAEAGTTFTVRLPGSAEAFQHDAAAQV